MDGVLTGLVAALVGGASGYVSAFLTNVIERRRVIDESVRAVRTSRYAELWRRTSVLPKWPRDEGVTYGDLAELSKWLRSWYFGTGPSTGTKESEPTGPSQTPTATTEGQGPGGMYLSAPARKAYGALQEQIVNVVARERDGESGDRPLSPQDYQAIQNRASRLRTEMTTDLLSRRRTFMVR
jgi:hypothetical protein